MSGVEQMKLNSKVTWGLAWAGLAVVVAVPSADYVTGALGLKGHSAAVITSTTDPVTAGTPAPQQTAAVTTTVTKTGVKIIPPAATTPGAPVLDPVDKYVNRGKPLPDYISDGGSGQTATTAPATGAPGAPALGTSSEQPTQVANVDASATVVPPVPFPRRPPDVVHPSLPKPARSVDPTVIVDEGSLPLDGGAAPGYGDGMPDQLAVTPDGPVPPAGIQDDWQNARDRRLTHYLEQNGLLDGASADGRSSASVTIIEHPRSDYDPNGFYLSDGPNNPKAERRARIMRMLEDSGDVTWF